MLMKKDISVYLFSKFLLVLRFVRNVSQNGDWGFFKIIIIIVTN